MISYLSYLSLRLLPRLGEPLIEWIGNLVEGCFLFFFLLLVFFFLALTLG